MLEESRYGRLAAELHALRALKAASSILDFEASGNPPDRYLVVFHGRGMCRTAHAPAHFAAVDLHRIEMRLAAPYPNRPPHIRWLTPLWHPNVGSGGLVTLPDIGLQWTRDLGLDLICERLWDVARGGYMDLAHGAHPWAQAFFLQRHGLRLPFDRRVLRDRIACPTVRARPTPVAKAHVAPRLSRTARREVLVIDEDTPLPRIPACAAPRSQTPANEGEVFYIGSE